VVQITITFLALLALAALAGAIAISTAMALRPKRALVHIGAHSGSLATAVAAVATLGSLFMSEVAGFTPCLLCWIQRGVMYPLVALIPLRNRLRLPNLALVALALGGAVVAAYHYAEERIPALAETSFCPPTIPCSFIWFERFGFVTLPLMAFSGFVAIAALMAVEGRQSIVAQEDI
jgi:disulfide bond formation protein DsbB